MTREARWDRLHAVTLRRKRLADLLVFARRAGDQRTASDARAELAALRRAEDMLRLAARTAPRRLEHLSAPGTA